MNISGSYLYDRPLERKENCCHEGADLVALTNNVHALLSRYGMDTTTVQFQREMEWQLLFIDP